MPIKKLTKRIKHVANSLFGSSTLPKKPIPKKPSRKKPSQEKTKQEKIKRLQKKLNRLDTKNPGILKEVRNLLDQGVWPVDDK